jgi:hypothetical protein
MMSVSYCTRYHISAPKFYTHHTIVSSHGIQTVIEYILFNDWVVCGTAGPMDLPKKVLYRVRSSASSFTFQHTPIPAAFHVFFLVCSPLYIPYNSVFQNALTEQHMTKPFSLPSLYMQLYTNSCHFRNCHYSLRNNLEERRSISIVYLDYINI